MSELISALEITSLVHGGRGLGRSNGKAVFVPLTAPGDVVACRAVKAKKSYVEAELVELSVPSSARRDAPCPYFGDCGGCQWQHLPYQEQLHWKEIIFKDQLVRQRLANDDVIAPIVASADEWHYRNRVQFKCHMTEHGLVMGFYRYGSHYVIDIHHCMLLRPEIQRVYELLRQDLPGCPAPDAVPQVDVAVGDNGGIRVLLHVLPHAKDKLHGWLKKVAEKQKFNACLQSGRKETIEVVHGEPGLKVVVDSPELCLEYGAGGFAQVNSAQNRRMTAAVISLLKLTDKEKVLDLFCGMGNFSLPVAKRAAQVVGVEDFAPSIEYARQNASTNNVDNADFHVGDAAQFLARFGYGEFDVVVLDPPRSGSYNAVKSLLSLQPQKILYVSCDSATLARDLKPLVHGGYQVVSAQPFDLFPQTWHIESITLLRKI